jgi:hypothetical protein
MSPQGPADDSSYPLGSTWRHTYPTGHEGLITKVGAGDYVVEVQPPRAADAAFVQTVPALQAGIDAANAEAGAVSGLLDWVAG